MAKKRQNKPFAKKSLGQNFLVDQNYTRKILEAVNPQIDELIIEIGAGRGALTESLLEKAGKVIAVELDDDLIPLLNETFGKYENFLLIHKDALQVNFSELVENNRLDSKKAKLAANLPYYISTAILQHLINYRESFSEMILMLQKEVVERITAEAGNKERGFLTVLIEAYFETNKLFDVPPNAFRPAPNIWSSVIRLVPKTIDEKLSKNEKLFKDLISTGFAQKRKTIYNNLKNAGEILYKKDLSQILSENGIDPKRRAETLTIDEWLDLTESFARK
jgi:16S rRNA (adenine1518-N6/adenine1519-N6)-dimethyltransferase